MEGLIITPEGVVSEFTGLGDLDALQAAVGGYIQALPLRDDLSGTMYMNEEGKLQTPPLASNPLATALVCELLPGDYIAGTVVVTGPVDEEGNDTPLDSKTAETITALAGARPCHVTLTTATLDAAQRALEFRLEWLDDYAEREYGEDAAKVITLYRRALDEIKAIA